MTKSWFVCAFVLAAVRAAAAGPVTVPITPGSVQVTVPSEWKSTQTATAATIVDPTGNAFVSFTVLPNDAAALKKAREAFDAQMKKVLESFTITTPMNARKLNGLDVMIGDADGTLKAGKKAVKMGIMLVTTPNKKILSCFAMVAADKEATLKKEVVAVLASISPLAVTTKRSDWDDGNVAAAPETIPTTAPAGTGKMAVSYAAPGDAVPVRKAVREEKVFEALTAKLSSAIKLPRDIPVVFDKCGAINAFYNPANHSITVCDELTEFFVAQAKAWKGTNQERGKRILDTLAFFFLHEVGHMLIDQLQIPAVGREEDAADQIAAVLLISSGEAGERVAIDGAVSFLTIMELNKGRPPQFADEHSLDEQRFYNIACLIFGSNPKKYEAMVTNKLLPMARARRCPTEWAKISGAWTNLLKPYMAH